MEKEVATLVRHSEPSSPPCLRGAAATGAAGSGASNSSAYFFNING